ncbi:MAG TPA: hypothetical protein VJH91_00140 [Candidatus Paceibacterota bacterium]
MPPRTVRLMLVSNGASFDVLSRVRERLKQSSHLVTSYVRANDDDSLPNVKDAIHSLSRVNVLIFAPSHRSRVKGGSVELFERRLLEHATELKVPIILVLEELALVGTPLLCTVPEYVAIVTRQKDDSGALGDCFGGKEPEIITDLSGAPARLIGLAELFARSSRAEMTV